MPQCVSKNFIHFKRGKRKDFKKDSIKEQIEFFHKSQLYEIKGIGKEVGGGGAGGARGSPPWG